MPFEKRVSTEDVELVAEVVGSVEDLYDDEPEKVDRRLKRRLRLRNLLVGIFVFILLVFGLGIFQTLSYKAPTGDYQLVTENKRLESVYYKKVGDALYFLDVTYQNSLTAILADDDIITRKAKISVLSVEIEKHFANMLDIAQAGKYSKRLDKEDDGKASGLMKSIIVAEGVGLEVTLYNLYVQLNKTHEYWLEHVWVENSKFPELHANVTAGRSELNNNVNSNIRSFNDLFIKQLGYGEEARFDHEFKGGA